MALPEGDRAVLRARLRDILDAFADIAKARTIREREFNDENTSEGIVLIAEELDDVRAMVDRIARNFGVKL